MTYPKPIMSVTELTKLGFSKDYLYQMYHKRGQKYATKTVGGKKILFDTERFEKARFR